MNIAGIVVLNLLGKMTRTLCMSRQTFFETFWCGVSGIDGSKTQGAIRPVVTINVVYLYPKGTVRLHQICGNNPTITKKLTSCGMNKRNMKYILWWPNVFPWPVSSFDLLLNVVQSSLACWHIHRISLCISLKYLNLGNSLAADEQEINPATWKVKLCQIYIYIWSITNLDTSRRKKFQTRTCLHQIGLWALASLLTDAGWPSPLWTVVSQGMQAWAGCER